MRFQEARLSELVEREISRQIDLMIRSHTDGEALRSTLPDIIRIAQDRVRDEYTTIRHTRTSTSQDQLGPCPPACQPPPFTDLEDQVPRLEEIPEVVMEEPDPQNDNSSSLCEPLPYGISPVQPDTQPEIVLSTPEMNRRRASASTDFGMTLEKDTQLAPSLMPYSTGQIEFRQTHNPVVYQITLPQMDDQTPAMPANFRLPATDEQRQDIQPDQMLGINDGSSKSDQI
jgi:hypothetical protein